MICYHSLELRNRGVSLAFSGGRQLPCGVCLLSHLQRRFRVRSFSCRALPVPWSPAPASSRPMPSPTLRATQQASQPPNTFVARLDAQRFLRDGVPVPRRGKAWGVRETLFLMKKNFCRNLKSPSAPLSQSTAPTLGVLCPPLCPPPCPPPSGCKTA